MSRVFFHYFRPIFCVIKEPNRFRFYTSSREEASYWVQRSKTSDPYSNKRSKKLDLEEEFGPVLDSSVFKSMKAPTAGKLNDYQSDLEVSNEVEASEQQSEQASSVASVDNVRADDSPGRVELLNTERAVLTLQQISLAEILRLPHQQDRAVPSITRVLAATMPEESRAALARWEKWKIAELGLEGFKALKAATFARGKTLHDILERFMETRQLPSIGELEDEVTRRHLVSLSQAVQSIERPLALESAVIHPQLHYSGILDCVAVINNTVTLLDWKTSEKVKNSAAALYDNPLQVAAYLGAMNQDPRYQALGNLDRAAVVVIYNSGFPAKVHHFHREELEQYWAQWCARLHMYRNL